MGYMRGFVMRLKGLASGGAALEGLKRTFMPSVAHEWGKDQPEA